MKREKLCNLLLEPLPEKPGCLFSRRLQQTFSVNRLAKHVSHTLPESITVAKWWDFDDYLKVGPHILSPDPKGWVSFSQSIFMLYEGVVAVEMKIGQASKIKEAKTIDIEEPATTPMTISSHWDSKCLSDRLRVIFFFLVVDYTSHFFQHSRYFIETCARVCFPKERVHNIHWKLKKNCNSKISRISEI